MAEFINPYTFVPLPDHVPRSAPAEHHRAVPGHGCGRMTVTWTLLTPLLLPKGQPKVEGGRVTIPGSSVKGAVRSLHEAMMGGCLRVFDADFVPVYRQPAVAKGLDWHLAVVDKATRDGRATHLRVASRTAWVPIDAARSALGRPPQTGDTLTIKDPASAIRKIEEFWRWEVTVPEAVIADDDDDWVIIVGDAGARQAKTKTREGKERRFLCAAGHLPQDTADRHLVDDAAWDEYVRLCEGTDDQRRIRQDPEAAWVKGWRERAVFTKVHWPDRRAEIGSRRIVTGRLWPGDVVWAHVDRERHAVDHLSMAAIWRVAGHGSLGERVPDDLHPCTRWDALCVSCRVFGSADTTGATPGAAAEQQAYAGHIRMGTPSRPA